MRNKRGKIQYSSVLIGVAIGATLVSIGWILGTNYGGSKISGPGMNDTNPVSGNSSNLKKNTISHVAGLASKSVVNINATKKDSKRMAQFFFNNPPSFRQGNSIIEPRKETGSGIIIKEDGYIVTNNHVIGNSTDITVTLSSNKSFKAKVIGRDSFTDLAVLKIEAKNLPVVQWGSSKNLKPGDWAIAIGSPMGLDHTVTVGIVSALDRSLDDLGDLKLIQTDAAINPGNSGGPLIDISGKVIGLNIAINADAQNISFAIPVDIVKEVSKELVEHGTIKRPYIGIMMQDISDELAEKLGLESGSEGIVVSKVKRDSPAYHAGIKAMDIIQRVDKKPIHSTLDVQKIVRSHKPKDKLSVLVMRQNQLVPLDVTIGEFPQQSNP